MKMTLLVATAFACLMFTANPKPSEMDGKGTVVVATPLHFDAAETAWAANLPCQRETVLMLPVTGYVVMTLPDFGTLAGFKLRPPKKWECKG